MDLKKIIREIPNYPEKGILFRDISTILSNPEAFSFTIEKLLFKRVKWFICFKVFISFSIVDFS